MCGFSQTAAIDSVRKRLRTEAKDTIYAKDLNELAWQFVDLSTDSSKIYAEKGLQLSTELNFTDGIADAKNTLGILYRYSGEFQKAITLYQQIIDLRIQQGNLAKQTAAFANLGSVYYEKGDNANALLYYKKALDNAEKTNYLDDQMFLLNNLGNAYKASGLYELSIDAYNKGLALNKKFNDEYQEAVIYGNLATTYDIQNLYEEALRYSMLAYDIFKRINNVRSLSSTVNNITLYTRHLNKYKETEMYLQEMKKLAEELKEDSYYLMYHQSNANYNNDIGNFSFALAEADKAIALGDSTNDIAIYATNFLIKANVLLNMKACKEGLRYYELGIKALKNVEDKTYLIRAFKGKSQALNCLGDYKMALDFYKRADEMMDTLNIEAYNTKIATLNALNQLDRKERELQLSNKEKESAEAKNKQQSQFLIAAIIIALLVLVFLLVSIRAYLIKRKDNELLNSQKNEIENKNSILHEQKQEIEHQMVLIEEKQKEILDSIHYAKRIQRALLAGKEMIDNNLPENFILFKPKDIVSGDFYWMAERDDKFYLAVCDSTGHGVPGAFMSLLNSSFLNEAVNEKSISAPNEVLNHVRNRLIQNLSQDGAKDGMDAILICYDKKTSTLTYAAANNKPILVNAEGMQEFPADKMPVGLGENLIPFALQTISVKKGDALYLYSDGYADQFGGPNGKKFKYKMLQSEILKNVHLPFSEQLKRMDEVFEAWRGDLEQVDDVLLVGLKF